VRSWRVLDQEGEGSHVKRQASTNMQLQYPVADEHHELPFFQTKCTSRKMHYLIYCGIHIKTTGSGGIEK